MERAAMSLDIGLAIQVAVLAGQAVKLVIDAAQHDRDHACSSRRLFPAPATVGPVPAAPSRTRGRPGPAGGPLPGPWNATPDGRAEQTGGQLARLARCLAKPARSAARPAGTAGAAPGAPMAGIGAAERDALCAALPDGRVTRWPATRTPPVLRGRGVREAVESNTIGGREHAEQVLVQLGDPIEGLPAQAPEAGRRVAFMTAHSTDADLAGANAGIRVASAACGVITGGFGVHDPRSVPVAGRDERLAPVVAELAVTGGHIPAGAAVGAHRATASSRRGAGACPTLAGSSPSRSTSAAAAPTAPAPGHGGSSSSAHTTFPP